MYILFFKYVKFNEHINIDEWLWYYCFHMGKVHLIEHSPWYYPLEGFKSILHFKFIDQFEICSVITWTNLSMHLVSTNLPIMQLFYSTNLCMKVASSAIDISWTFSPSFCFFEKPSLNTFHLNHYLVSTALPSQFCKKLGSPFDSCPVQVVFPSWNLNRNLHSSHLPSKRHV